MEPCCGAECLARLKRPSTGHWAMHKKVCAKATALSLRAFYYNQPNFSVVLAHNGLGWLDKQMVKSSNPPTKCREGLREVARTHRFEPGWLTSNCVNQLYRQRGKRDRDLSIWDGGSGRLDASASGGQAGLSDVGKRVEHPRCPMITVRLRKTEPGFGERMIVGYTVSAGVDPSQAVLTCCQALCGRASAPLQGRLSVRSYAVAKEIHQSEVVLRGSVALGGRLLEPLNCGR